MCPGSAGNSEESVCVAEEFIFDTTTLREMYPLGRELTPTPFGKVVFWGNLQKLFLTRRKILELYAQTSLKIVLTFVYILLSVSMYYVLQNTMSIFSAKVCSTNYLSS